MTAPGPDPLPPRAGPVVDADGHVMEPESAWAEVPAPYRPRISADGAGYEHVVVGDTEILAVPLGNLARPGSTFDDPTTFRPLADALPGGSDPVARLRDMDGEGIDQAVLYPTIGLYFSAVEEPAAAVALAAAYNDWLTGYCAAASAPALRGGPAPAAGPGGGGPRASPRRHRARLRRRLRPSQPLPGPLAVRPRLRRGVGGGRGARRADRHPRGQLGDRADLGSDRPFNPLILHASVMCRLSGRTAPSTHSSAARRTRSRRCWPARS